MLIRYILEQNQQIKGMNRIRNTMAMAVRRNAWIRNEFEQYSQQYAVEVINNMVKDSEYDTPYEMYMRSKHNYGLFHPFGCHSFAYVPMEKRKKNEPKMRSSIYKGPSKEG